jgi:hypothetical protein
LLSISGRLGVRLPAGNAALDTCTAAHKATQDAANAAHVLVPGPGSSGAGEAYADVRANHERLIAATADFMRAANDIVGTRVPDDE